MNRKTRTLAFLLCTMSPALFASPIDRMIDRLDTDGDGKVSREEFGASEHGMVKRMDSSGDGVLTEDEITAHIRERETRMAGKMEEMESRLREHFAEADTNGDGMVTREEAQSARFAKTDADGDGFVTAEELFAARPDRHHRMGHHRPGAFAPRDEG